VAKLVRHKPSLFSNSQFFDFRTCMCTGLHALTTKKSFLLHRWLKSASLFFTHLFTQIASHEQLWRPHRQPQEATRIAACSSRSPLSRTREKIFTPTVQGVKNAHLQQANASVCGRKISLDPLSCWHMMGKQHIGAYATERSLTNIRTHRQRHP
jgi:hypothetical protein